MVELRWMAWMPKNKKGAGKSRAFRFSRSDFASAAAFVIVGAAALRQLRRLGDFAGIQALAHGMAQLVAAWATPWLAARSNHI